MKKLSRKLRLRTKTDFDKLKDLFSLFSIDYYIHESVDRQEWTIGIDDSIQFVFDPMFNFKCVRVGKLK